MVGFDLLFENENLLWKNEIFHSSEYSTDDRLAFYTQPAQKLSDQWIVHYRFDYLDPGQHLNKSIEHVLGVNYLPISTIRLRLAYFYKEFENPNTENNIFQFSTTISF